MNSFSFSNTRVSQKFCNICVLNTGCYCVRWNYEEVIHYEFVLDGRTISANLYSGVDVCYSAAKIFSIDYQKVSSSAERLYKILYYSERTDATPSI